MSEELKSNENVGAPQPDALAQIASVDPSHEKGLQSARQNRID